MCNVWWYEEKWSLEVFFFINLVDNSKVTCCICDTEVSRGGKVAEDFHTSNMRKHLRNTHPEDYKKLRTKKMMQRKAKVGNYLSENHLKSHSPIRLTIQDHEKSPKELER